jgi:hypothetical protein
MCTSVIHKYSTRHSPPSHPLKIHNSQHVHTQSTLVNPNVVDPNLAIILTAGCVHFKPMGNVLFKVFSVLLGLSHLRNCVLDPQIPECGHMWSPFVNFKPLSIRTPQGCAFGFRFTILDCIQSRLVPFSCFPPCNSVVQLQSEEISLLKGMWQGLVIRNSSDVIRLQGKEAMTGCAKQPCSMSALSSDNAVVVVAVAYLASTQE